MAAHAEVKPTSTPSHAPKSQEMFSPHAYLRNRSQPASFGDQPPSFFSPKLVISTVFESR
jgi:hypothetical protein